MNQSRSHMITYFHTYRTQKLVICRGGHGSVTSRNIFIITKASFPLRGPRACHVKKFYFRPTLAWARLDGPWAERSIPLFFSLKLSKILKNNIKHGPDPQEARAWPAGWWIKSVNFRHNPPLTGSGHARPVISLSPPAKSMNRPGPTHAQI